MMRPFRIRRHTEGGDAAVKHDEYIASCFLSIEIQHKNDEYIASWSSTEKHSQGGDYSRARNIRTKVSRE